MVLRLLTNDVNRGIKKVTFALKRPSDRVQALGCGSALLPESALDCHPPRLDLRAFAQGAGMLVFDSIMSAISSITRKRSMCRRSWW